MKTHNLMLFLFLIIFSTQLYSQNIICRKSISFHNIVKAKKNPAKVKSLSLDNKNLFVMPKEIFQFTNIEFLSLTRNCITSIPDSINKLFKLKHLYLSFNPIDSLPKTLIELKELRYVLLINTGVKDTEIEYFKGEMPNCIFINRMP